MIEKLRRAADRSLDLLFEPRMLWALLAWPRFSFTSYRMLSDLRAQGVRPGTIIDVGANVGQFACAALELLEPRLVHCFEPVPDCVEELRRHLRCFAHTTVHPIALSDCAGERTLYVNAHRHASSMLPLAEGHREAFPRATIIGDVSVRVSTLDDELADAEFVPPVLLKLDVQGAEASVLRGAAKTLERVDSAIVETSLKPMYESEASLFEIINLMEGYEFRFVRPLGFLSHPRTHEVLQMDVLFQRIGKATPPST